MPQGYDEMEYARIAARHFGTDHHEHYVTPAELVSAIPQVAAHYDQPFGNSSAVPAFICATLAREHGVRKLLAGDGGDELFGGNSRYAKQKVFEAWWRVPAALRAARRAAARQRPDAQRCRSCAKAASYVDQASVPMPARLETYNLLKRFGSCERVHARVPGISRSGSRAGITSGRGLRAASRRRHSSIACWPTTGALRWPTTTCRRSPARRAWRASTSAFRCSPMRSSTSRPTLGTARQGARTSAAPLLQGGAGGLPAAGDHREEEARLRPAGRRLARAATQPFGTWPATRWRTRRHGV